MSRNESSSVVGLLAIGALIIMCIVGGFRSCSVGTGELTYIEATVTDKGIKSVSKSEDMYLVYTKTADGVEVFQITDSWLAGRFDSSDVYASIEVGKTYKFGVRGERNEFMSWYPNIYEFEEIAE